jgi:predicted secreted hydrolase
VWLEDWTLEATTDSTFPLRLEARDGQIALRLGLAEGKPLVLQGDRGLSQKGPEPGNASYYYAQTRMPAAGTLVLGVDTLAVHGSAWLDREWSTSALADGQVGWDWFALQLDDGWDLMIYQLRRADGSADQLSDGVLIDPDGRRIPLTWGSDVSMEATGTWTSPIDGAVYPSGWRIRVPSRDWDVVVTPRISDQELDVSFRYWEGAVAVEGAGEGGAPVEGRGYVELTGYAGTG